ncbi:MAG: L,D-transpeptidase family protein [Pseudomonadota bacterium]
MEKSRQEWKTRLWTRRAWSVWGLILALSLNLAGIARAALPAAMIPDALIEPGAGPGRKIIVVEKSTQQLYVYEFKMGRYYLHKNYDCSTGENIGDKKVQGDKRTPEGTYLFVKKALEHELAPIYGVLAFPMDYPNFWDQREGKNGMGIWMHGTNKILAPRDSNGCIALDNVDIIELEPLVSLYDTPIIIYDKIRYKTGEAMNREAARVKAFIESWRKAWVKKDAKAYQEKYALDFVSDDGKNYTGWLEHKKRLNEVYKNIRVDLGRLRIYRHRPDILVALFDQYYQGDSFVSDGEKRLFIRESRDGLKIAAESWAPFPPKVSPPLLSAEVKQRIRSQKRTPHSAFAKIAVAAPPGPAVTASAAPAPVAVKQTASAAPAPVAVKQTASAAPAPVAAKKSATKSAANIQPGEKGVVERALDDWLRDWGRKDIDGYVAHYHPDFTFNNMDLTGFREYKKQLAQKYKEVTIKVENLKIKVDGRSAFVSFIQNYRSDQYRDYGLKTLLLKKEKEKWLIFEESWQDISGGGKP